MSATKNNLLEVLLAAAILLPSHSVAQAATSARQTAKKPAAPAQKRLTVDDVLAMVAAGISDDVIVAKLHKEDQAFDLSPEDLIRLKKGKVSDPVLKIMLDPKAQPPAAQPTLVTPQPVIVQSPLLPGIITPNRSGATPSPGASGNGDQNDPLAAHDSGIYLLTKDRDGKPQMIVLERAAYQGAKTGGMLQSAMTYGIMKAKTKAVIPGPRAGIRVNEPAPVFYFYFDDKQAGLGKTFFGVGNLSNPNQFALLKLEVNKSNRETIVGQFSALGSSSGSDSHSMIPFKSERIRAGLYKVTVDGLKAGEYCFLASSNNTMVATPMGAYGAGASSPADIFDFGVSVD
jgi:hypothetical protein